MLSSSPCPHPPPFHSLFGAPVPPIHPQLLFFTHSPPPPTHCLSLQPIRNNNPWMLLFFISFLLIVSFFVLNMFVGVVVENFHKCRQQQEEEEARLREKKRQKRLEKKRRSEKTSQGRVGIGTCATRSKVKSYLALAENAVPKLF